MCRNFITKCRKNVLPNAAAFLLENTSMVVQKGGRYYKMRRFYYKTRQVLQNTSIITKRGTAASSKTMKLYQEI